MQLEEAQAWLRGERSTINYTQAPTPEESRINAAKQDASMTEQAYWIVRAHKEGITEDAHQFRPMEDGDGECGVCHMGIGHESHWKPAPQKGEVGYSAWLENDGTATPVTEDK